eukprot:Nitzschia sp. Nitz4//scaffold27_size158506//39129//39600//NITZ4_002587-RA/size158506-snap-gene-0.212-mRNA-1//-1//CDS//3329545449//5012//frame0
MDASPRLARFFQLMPEESDNLQQEYDKDAVIVSWFSLVVGVSMYKDPTVFASYITANTSRFVLKDSSIPGKLCSRFLLDGATGDKSPCMDVDGN